MTGKFIKSLLKRIDIFGQPIYLRLNMKEEFKTGCGGFLTLALIILSIYIGVDAFSNLMNYTNLYSTTTFLYVKEPEFINFNTKEQPFAMSFDPDDYNKWFERKFFEIDMEETTQTRYENGSLIKARKKIQLRPCEARDFPTLEEEFERLGMRTWLCPVNGTEFTIGGDYSSQKFAYVRFRISRCLNSTANNFSCVSNETYRETIISKEGKLRFRIHFLNRIIRLEKLENPYSSHLKTNLFFNLDPVIGYKTADIFFLPNEVITDFSLVSFSKYNETVITYNDEMREQSSSSVNSSVLGEFFLRVSNTKLRYNRSYTKLGAFLAYIGGFWTTLYLIAEAIAKKYNHRALFIKLANKLYHFQWETDASQENKKAKLKESKEKKLQKINPENDEDASPHTPIGLKSRLILMARISSYLAEFKKLTPSFVWGIFQGIFPSFLFQSRTSRNKMILYEKALDLVGKDLDVVHILAKFQELDKLKHILLDKEQRVLFEFCPRQVINNVSKQSDGKKASRVLSSRFSMIFQERRDSSRNSGRKNSFGKTKDMEMPFYLDLYKSFEFLKKREPSSNIDEKLVDLIGIDILKIFQRHHLEMQILSEDDPSKRDEKKALLKKITEEFRLTRRQSEQDLKRLTYQNFKLKWQGVRGQIKGMSSASHYVKHEFANAEITGAGQEVDRKNKEHENLRIPSKKIRDDLPVDEIAVKKN